ncbi:MAG: 2,3-bisphosphoglycerate-independent phosphoglycerate mutase [Peptococcaceae bacterium]|nr:2,3-bisphosphoglycerate-independent phosphoglycerate mutase [Peptococcaceae bacterium]MBQ2449275.1 2,3-bisphosphoglycerate-independent phosphoglycerate mutase [Peptococcaceae bacterium]
MNKQLPVVLMILDGWGISEHKEGNAIAQSNTENMDRLLAQYGHSQLFCSGEYVGLPEGQQGNSEVGHLNLGAGRVVYQELTRINKAVREHTLQDNPAFQNVMAHCMEQNKALHLMGLVSPGGVHSHSSHLYGLLEMAAAKGLKEVYVHCFLDGRDVGPSTGLGFVEELEDKLQQIGVGRIATVSGRYYAMDRDNRWERVEKAYRAMTAGAGETAASAVEAVQQSYDKGETDEFVLPTVVQADGKPVAVIQAGDGVIFFNFRGDRAREISKAFVNREFDGFSREYLGVQYVAMTQYEEGLDMTVAFPPQDLQNTLGQVLADNQVKQFRVAETEKYAHVTFFFNGGVEEPNPLEDRLLVPSPKVATYDLQPEMSAIEVKDKLIEAIKGGEYPFILVNFANTDMVGHTGIPEAAQKAVETVDKCVGEVADAVKNAGGVLLITADHGNAEQMVDPVKGTPHTAHTANPVPFVVMSAEPYTVKDGSLQDVAPTVLKLLGIDKPADMTGESLI